MYVHRLLLAFITALAVAVAPIGFALAANQALAKSAMVDCHGKAAENHSCCDTMTTCPDSCGFKCCKLMGIVAALPVIDVLPFAPPEAVDPLKPPDWQMRPRPPPPRS